MADPAKAGQLLDVDVDQVARRLALVALHWWLSLPRFQGQCLESCFYTDPMKTNDHNECLVYATPLQR